MKIQWLIPYTAQNSRIFMCCKLFLSKYFEYNEFFESNKSLDFIQKRVLKIVNEYKLNTNECCNKKDMNLVRDYIFIAF
jgi:hypothetical protein